MKPNIVQVAALVSLRFKDIYVYLMALIARRIFRRVSHRVLSVLVNSKALSQARASPKSGVPLVVTCIFWDVSFANAKLSRK